MTSRVASLEAVISANVTGFQSAAAQVKSSLNGIANEAKRTGGLMSAALDPASKFSQTTESLTAAFRRGDISARQYEKGLASASWQAMNASEKFGVMRQKVNAAGLEFAKFSAAAVAVGYAGKEIYNFAKAGASLEYTGYQFERLAKGAGTTSDVLLNDLRAATRGTVSDAGLVANATDFMRLGLANTSDEVIRLSKVASALNMDMGELTLTLANQSTRRFDQLGVSLDGFKDRLEALKKTGMDTDAAFKEAFLQQAEAQVLKVGNVADTSLGNYKRLEAELANYANAAKMGFANMPLPIFGGQGMNQATGQVANTLQAIRLLASGDYKISGGLGWNWKDSQLNFDVTKRDRRMVPVYGGMGGTTYAPSKYTYAQENRGDESRFVSRATGAPNVAAAPIDYANVLKGGMDLTQMSMQYAAQSQVLNQQLSDQTAILDQLGIRYAKTGKDGKAAYMEQADKVDALKQAVKDLDTQYADSMSSIAMNTLKAKGASDEQTLNFAKASGQISQDAYNQAVAMGKVTDAYMSGKIGAGDYASVVAGLQNLLKGMSGTAVNTYIDVWIRTHGSMPGVGASAPGNISLQGAGLQNTLNGPRPGDRRWTGGPLGRGVTIVGDAPGGGMTPYTEAIIDGYVVDAKTTRELAKAGLLEGATARVTGGDIGYEPGYYNGGITTTPDRTAPPAPPRVRGRFPGRTNTAMGGRQAAPEVSVSQPTPTLGAFMQVGEQTQQNISQNFDDSTRRQQETQKESTGVIVAAIERTNDLLARMPTQTDAYNNARAAQQMSV